MSPRLLLSVLAIAALGMLMVAMSLDGIDRDRERIEFLMR